MTEDLPQQRLEGALLQHALEQDGRSIRAVASLAGMSDARWRQIVKGHMTTGGHVTPVIAPAATLARMALVMDLSPGQLRDAGRLDAAAVLERMLLEGVPDPSPALPPAAATQPDEIELIYASATMTARQKLDAIRMVLQLRAEVESQSGARSEPERNNGEPRRATSG